MKRMISSMPWSVVLLLCGFLGLAPFTPEPHIVEKLRMLLQGTLVKPLDIFDLCYHALPFFLLLFKIITSIQDKK